MKKTLLILAMILGLSAFAKDKIIVYTYHNHAPFITIKNHGLSFDLIQLLNEKTSEAYEFELKVVPRGRLNYILKPWIQGNCQKKTKKCNPNFMVLWVNHKWGFGKDALSNFTWIPLFEDSNVIVSSKSNKVEYQKPEDLIGKKLAGVSGHKYLGIDDLVKEGKINRINGNSELENLQVVLASRVDVTLLPKSAFNYYQMINKNFRSLYLSKMPHQKYMRNIMTSVENKKLINFLKSLELTSRF